MRIIATVVLFAFFAVPCLGAAEKEFLDPAVERKLTEIVSILRLIWGQDFETKYEQYMVGSPSTVILIPRSEMIKVAKNPKDGRKRDGKTTQGIVIDDKRILVVYDDIPALFVARTINHEIGHVELQLPRHQEEARIRKVVDIGFFEKALGREWVEKTTAELQKMAWPVKYNGHVYNGYDIPKVVRKFYDRLEEGGSRLEKTELNDIIIENLVFLFVNEEDDLAAALVAVGEGDN